MGSARVFKVSEHLLSIDYASMEERTVVSLVEKHGEKVVIKAIKEMKPIEGETFSCI